MRFSDLRNTQSNEGFKQNMRRFAFIIDLNILTKCFPCTFEEGEEKYVSISKANISDTVAYTIEVGLDHFVWHMVGRPIKLSIQNEIKSKAIRCG